MLNVIDLQTWLEKNEDTVFSFWVYRRGYTPYEQDQKFMDESQFEDSTADTARITEIVRLGEDKYMVGLRIVYVEDGEEEDFGMTEYYMLDEIRLAVFDNQQLREETDDSDS